MPRSHRRLFAAVATGSVIAIGAATGFGVTTVAFHDVDAMWLTITFTVLSAVLGLICAVIYLHEETRKRTQELHEETRKHTAATADKLVKTIAAKVTLELHVALGKTIKEQLDAAETLDEATTRWQELTHGDAGMPPIDLQRWKTTAAADLNGTRRRGAAGSPAS